MPQARHLIECVVSTHPPAKSPVQPVCCRPFSPSLANRLIGPHSSHRLPTVHTQSLASALLGLVQTHAALINKKVDGHIDGIMQRSTCKLMYCRRTLASMDAISPLSSLSRKATCRACRNLHFRVLLSTLCIYNPQNHQVR